MKKILLTIILSIILINSSIAEIRRMDSERFNSHRHGIANAGGGSAISTACVNGYVFVTYHDYSYGHGNDGGNSNAVSIVQFFEVRDGRSLPKKC